MAKSTASLKSNYELEETLQNGTLLEEPNFINATPPGMGLAKSQSDAAEYAVEMLVVLCNMAKDVDLKFLAYLLEMAYEESLNHVEKSPSKSKK